MISEPMTNELKQVRDEINVIRKVIIDLASSNNREDVDVAQTYQNGLAKCVSIMTTLDRLIAGPSGDVAAALDAINKMPCRSELLGGQHYDYLLKEEVVAVLENAIARAEQKGWK